MKRILLVVLVAITVATYGQSPCEFSWQAASTTNGLKNYVTPPRSQPYQGPCMTFAFTAAIESRYAMENNISGPAITLSDAYLDYKVLGANNFEAVLEQGFKIPLASNANSFPYWCPIGGTCDSYASAVSKCINSIDGQQSYIFEVVETGPNSSALVPQCVGPIGDYVKVNSVEQVTTITTEEALKLSIMTKGPAVIRVNGWSNITQFRDYPTPIVAYHSFLIIGWKNTPNGTTWLMKDSWPGMTGILYSKPNPTIISDSSRQFFHVSGVGVNGSAPANKIVPLNVVSCSETPVLSEIDIEFDEIFLNDRMYHRFSVSSNLNVDTWTWGIDYPNGAWKRSQTNTLTTSTILMSPTTSGVVTVFVNAFRNGVKVTKTRSVYLSNGGSGGMH